MNEIMRPVMNRADAIAGLVSMARVLVSTLSSDSYVRNEARLAEKFVYILCHELMSGNRRSIDRASEDLVLCLDGIVRCGISIEGGGWALNQLILSAVSGRISLGQLSKMMEELYGKSRI